jgi:cystathionine beta-lyase/cystathionine gamma-synthase
LELIVVLHSTTKYINGHSDVIGGCLITSDDKIAERFKFLQNSVGSVPSPFDCWLILRATKTLAQRMKCHNENAMKICDTLTKDKRILKIFLSGFKNSSSI